MKALLILMVVVSITATAAVQLFPECATELAVSAKRSLADLERASVTLDDGTEYIYLDSDSENINNKPVMVLLHGFGADKDNFTEVAPYLINDYRLISPDHQGFAESTKDNTADYSPAAQTVRLNKLFNQLGLEQFILGGSSMGGLIAMTYAEAYSDRVRALWLLDPAGVATAPISEMRQTIRETGVNPLVATTVDEFHGVFNYVMSQPPFIPDFVLETKAKVRIQNAELEKRIFSQIRAVDITPIVTGLEIPALIVWGEEDRVLHPGGAAILANAMPNHKVIMMPGIGHLPMLEAPAEVASDLLEFLAAKL